MIDVGIGLVGGALAGALGGFVAAVLMLTARRLRNARLIRRGEPGKKDLVLPRFHGPGAAVGALAGATSAAWAPLPFALGIAFAAPLLLLTPVIAVVAAGAAVSGR